MCVHLAVSEYYAFSTSEPKAEAVSSETMEASRPQVLDTR